MFAVNSQQFYSTRSMVLPNQFLTAFITSTMLFIFLAVNFFGTILSDGQTRFCGVSNVARDDSSIYYCELPNYNETGTCQPLQWCFDLQLRPDHYKTLHVCRYTDSGEIAEICCSERKAITPGSRSQISCENYFPSAKPSVVPANGNFLAARAKPLEFPHMASVGFGDKPSIEWLCGGTIIHPQFVLTAAHCTISHDRTPTWVRVNDLNLDLPNEVNGTRDIRITQIYRHPNYRHFSFYHDIALLKLATVLDFHSDVSVKPACLHTNEPSRFWENDLQIIGWGAAEFLGERSSHLLKGNMSVVDYEECRKRYPKSRKLSNGIKREFQICAGNAFGGDTCQGDSGGPLHFYTEKINLERIMKGSFSIYDGILPAHFVIIGITSFGNGCGGGRTTGVYTKVQPYLTWIEDTIWPMCETEEKLIFID